MKLLKESEVTVEEINGMIGRRMWGHCVIDFEKTPFQLGDRLEELEFDEGIYQGVIPMTGVYGTDTVAVCLVSCVQPR